MKISKLIRLSFLVVGLCSLADTFSGTAFGQANAKVPDPDPEIERKSFIVADGFEVNLFAADPLLAKPIQMNFDAKGRLWIASSEVYPQIKPGQKANDKILILEDTKGVGKADKVTVFADGLLIPTGVEPGDGGAYVANSTELLHLTSSKGGKADKSRVVLSGFGTEDTHHILHTLRWGPEGLLYFNQSIYIHSHIETPHGVRRLNGGGIWWFRPETMQLEVFLRGFVNTWGHHFDAYGQSLVTDGANGEGINHGIPGAYYPTAVGASRILQGMNPGSPKHCGLEVVSGTHLPEEWRGNVLTNDFRGHRVCRFVLKDDGSSYSSQEKPELIKTNHPAFRPIDIKMGPDGAIYIADWYNPIIQHGEVDFRDPRRDHTHGRIWRVTAKNRPLVKRSELVTAKTEELLNHLKSPEDWTRHHAKRVMKERGGKEVLPLLEAWVKKLDPKEADYEKHMLEALWTYQSLDTPELNLLNTLLSAKDFHVRAAATRVLTYWHPKISNALELLALRVADENARVRYEAVRSLSALKTARAAEVAMTALDRPVDKILDYSLWLTARELEPYWMPAFRQGTIDFGGNARQLTFALQAVGSQSAVQPLMALLNSGKIAKDREAGVWQLIGTLGGTAELDAVFQRALNAELGVGQQAQLLQALEESFKQRKARPAKEVNRVKSLFNSTSESVRLSAIRLAGLWKIEELRDQLTTLAKEAKTPISERQAAMDALVYLGGDATKGTLDSLAGSETALPVRRQAVIALAAVDVQLAAKRAVEVLTTATANDNPADVIAVFLQRKTGADALVKALNAQKLPADIAKIGIRAVRNGGQDFPTLTEALNKAGGLAQLKREMTSAELNAFVADVAKLGDPARGEAIYRRKDMSCIKCHAIGGAGGQVGPDLTSIGASAQVDYLIDSILLPNKAVKENYHSLNVVTVDERVITGIKIRETKTELILRTADDKEISIPIKDIEDKRNGRSLMPDGLADPLTRQELLDLTRFLSELGKVGPYSLSKGRVARRFLVLEPTSETMGVLRRGSVVAATSNDPALSWASGYTQVSGILPLDSIPSLVIFKDNPPVGVVRCQVDVTAAGKVKLRVNSATGLRAWLGNTAFDLKDETVIDLPQGLQNITIAVDLNQRKEGIRFEVEEIPNSSARVSVLGGK